MENDNKVTRREFLDKGKKLAYLTPVILTVLGMKSVEANNRRRSSHSGDGVSPAGNTSSNSRGHGYGRY